MNGYSLNAQLEIDEVTKERDKAAYHAPSAPRQIRYEDNA